MRAGCRRWSRRTTASAPLRLAALRIALDGPVTHEVGSPEADTRELEVHWQGRRIKRALARGYSLSDN